MDSPSGGSFHRGGPVWGDWEIAGRKRYLNRGNPADDKPDLLREPQDKLGGLSAWIGPQFPHFGHLIADAATRFLATSKQSGIDTFLIGDKEDNQYGLLRPTTRSVLDWFDIDTSRVRVANRPTTSEVLVTLPQSEQRDRIGPCPKYLDLLTQHQHSKFWNHSGAIFQKCFVSRAGMPAHIAGESYLEAVFSELGFQIIRPETMSLSDQLWIYVNANELVFTEGSALHSLQLLGSVRARVWVINRRPNGRLGDHLFSPRVSAIDYLEAEIGLIHGCRLSGEPAPETGLAIPTSHGLSKCLSIISGKNVAINSQEYEKAIKTDVEIWLKHETKQKRYGHSSYLSTLMKSVKNAGLEGLSLRF
ncbi:glycosyltransferase 61 family protein [Roseicyclus mahoneyensis]